MAIEVRGDSLQAAFVHVSCYFITAAFFHRGLGDFKWTVGGLYSLEVFLVGALIEYSV